MNFTPQIQNHPLILSDNKSEVTTSFWLSIYNHECKLKIPCHHQRALKVEEKSMNIRWLRGNRVTEQPYAHPITTPWKVCTGQ